MQFVHTQPADFIQQRRVHAVEHCSNCDTKGSKNPVEQRRRCFRQHHHQSIVTRSNRDKTSRSLRQILQPSASAPPIGFPFRAVLHFQTMMIGGLIRPNKVKAASAQLVEDEGLTTWRFVLVFVIGRFKAEVIEGGRKCNCLR